MSARSRDSRRELPLNEPAPTAAKRAASMLSAHRQKRIYTPPEEPGFRVGPMTEGSHHVRWLIESVLCSRILGPGGKRLKYMKDSTNDPTIQARISAKAAAEVDYRVFSCSGSAISVSKIVGLLVRYIYDEPETGYSSADSARYDFKLLVPKVFVDKLSGSGDKNLREMEERSNAVISFEPGCLPSSDEQCMHIYGVADAVQIAVYFTLETMKRAETALNVSPHMLYVNQFDPNIAPRLTLSASQQSDPIPRLRVGLPGHNPPGSANGRVNGSRSPEDQPNSSSANTSREQPAVTRTNESTLDHKIELPTLTTNANVPQSIYTAYDIAKDSQRSHLRQVVQIGEANMGTPSDRATLVDNIKRVTACKVEEGIHGIADHFDDHTGGDLSLVVEGPPEENAFAMLLIYRYLKKQQQSQTATP